MSHSPHLYGYAIAIVLTASVGWGWHAGWTVQPPAASAGAASFREARGAGWRLQPADRASAATRSSSCEAAREAFLTGDEADIILSMNTLMADRTVNDTARELARDYIDRGKASRNALERVQSFCDLGRGAPALR